MPEIYKNIISPWLDKQVQIFPTETCNLKCDGCPYPDQSRKKRLELLGREIDPERWKETTDYLYGRGNRLFCVMGGEPASYGGISTIIENITSYPDAFVLLSTSGIHLLKNQNLRESVGEALSKPLNREFKNGIAISFDAIPALVKPRNSREFKARQGLDLVKVMKKKYDNRITYIANVMVTPENLSSIPEIQAFLETEGIQTNLCTQQGKCFGESTAVFNSAHMLELSRVGTEMIRRKIRQGLVVNSVSYLSQLPGIIGMEDYHCWQEPDGSPVIDVGSDGKFRYCNWIGQNRPEGPPGVNGKKLIDGTISWDEFWLRSKETTAMLCKGCSWSRRDRGIKPMVSFNPNILKESNLPFFDPQELRLQNIWVQAQMLDNK